MLHSDAILYVRTLALGKEGWGYLCLLCTERTAAPHGIHGNYASVWWRVAATESGGPSASLAGPGERFWNWVCY